MIVRQLYILIFLCSISFNNVLTGQQKVQITIGGKHVGSFDLNISPGEIVDYKGDTYTIDFTGREGEKTIGLYIQNLTWSKGDKDNSLVIKKNWFTDNGNLLTPLASCLEIRPRTTAPLEVLIAGSGTTTLQVFYAVKTPQQSCRKVKPTAANKGFFNIHLVVKGIESGQKSSASPDAENIHWKTCVEHPKSTSCLQQYIRKFPRGKQAENARGRLIYYAEKHYYPAIEKAKSEKNTRLLVQQCERFLDSFPSYVSHYGEVKRLLTEARSGSMFAESGESSPSAEDKTIESPPNNTSSDQIPDVVPSPEKEPDIPTPEPAIKTEDDLAWEEAKSNVEDRCQAYTAYIDENFTKYRDEALKKKATFCDMTIKPEGATGNRAKFVIENVFSLQIDTIIPMIGQPLTPKKVGDYSYELDVPFPDERNFVIHFSDPDHPKGIRRSTIPIGDLLTPEVLIRGDSIFFTFNKGKPPFRVYFSQENGGVAFEKATDKRTLLLTQTMLRDDEKLAGKYLIEVSDKILNAPFSEKEWVVDIKSDSWQWPYAVAIGSILLILLGAMLRSFQGKRKKKKKEELETFMQSRQQSLADLHKKQLDENAWAKPIEIQNEEGLPVAADQSAAPAIVPEKKGSIKITGLRKSSKKTVHYNNAAQLAPLLKSTVFSFDPGVHWHDTIIVGIYFTKNSIHHLDHFLVTQNLKPVQENEGSVPEIGGILMGRPHLYGVDGKYRIVVNEFVPINPEFHDVFQLEFSTESLVKDLGDIQDQYPNDTAVGWFHTHPGHGLFLSKPDLVIQEQFFGEPYQFAMEIDSLTEKLDTAFFTRTMNGEINNTNDKKQASWFSWLENVEALGA